MSKSIAVVGITGDPPTVGHIWLARTAANTGYFDDIWLMPCYKHKLGKKTVDAEHRFLMCNIAAKEVEGCVTSDYEIKNGLDGACYLTTMLLREDYPDDSFTWVVGMDNAINLDMWMNSTVLKKGDLIPFLVCNRGGIAVPPGRHWFLSPPHHYVEGDKSVECSSRDFRNAYRQNRTDCIQMVSPGVLAYIVEHGLYQ